MKWSRSMELRELKKNGYPSEDLKLVARALLPAEIMEGSRLKYELMQYEIVEG